MTDATKPHIAVDFDNTLCRSKYPECGPAIPGGREALLRFRELGYWIIIYSCRTCHWLYEMYPGEKDVNLRPSVIKMRQWLIDNDIPFDEIDDGSRGKPVAQFYIDDRGISFRNNWEEIADFVAKQVPVIG